MIFLIQKINIRSNAVPTHRHASVTKSGAKGRMSTSVGIKGSNFKRATEDQNGQLETLDFPAKAL